MREMGLGWDQEEDMCGQTHHDGHAHNSHLTQNQREKQAAASGWELLNL